MKWPFIKIHHQRLNNRVCSAEKVKTAPLVIEAKPNRFTCEKLVAALGVRHGGINFLS